MLKTVTLALACCSALFSLNAQAALQALDNQDLRDVTGQAGITMTIDLKTQIGKVAWEDDGSSLQIRNLVIDNGCVAPGDCPAGVAYGAAKLYFINPMVNAPTLKVDVVADGATQKLQLQLPDLKTTSDQLLADGLITQPLTIRLRIAGELGLGDQGAPGSSTLGAFEIRDISNIRSTLRVWGH